MEHVFGIVDSYSEYVKVSGMGTRVLLGNHFCLQAEDMSAKEQMKDVLTMLDESMNHAGVTKEQLIRVDIFAKNYNEEMDQEWTKWVDSENLPTRFVCPMGEPRFTGVCVEVTAEAFVCWKANAK